MSFTVSDLLTQLRADGITTTDISDADATTQIGYIREKFDAYRPPVYYLINGITTVDDQEDYTFPSGASEILEVLWFPNLSNASIQSLLDEMKLGITGEEGIFNYPSLTAIWNLKYAQFNKRYGGSWTTYYNSSNVRVITLHPSPDQNSISVPVIYTKNHQSSLSTIPDSEKELFYEGLIARVEDMFGRKQMKSGGFRAGTYSVSGDSGSAIRTFAGRRYNDWLLRISATAAAGRS